jgi:toxin ParE1/3/4
MKIVWTEFAITELKVILDFYIENANPKVAHRIRIQILSSTKQLSKYPESGQIEPHLVKLKKQYRYLIVGHWKVLYRVDDKTILIADIFDVRQNPRKLTTRNR